jgi:hexosaminidase
MKKIFVLILVLAGCIYSANAVKPSIIPLPAKLEILQGTYYLTGGSGLQFDKKNKDLVRIGGLLNEYLHSNYGMVLISDGRGDIHLKLDPGCELGEEAYTLVSGENGIVITASHPAGIFYGIQTLKQLLPLEAKDGQIEIPAVNIADQPRFQWRGNLLDVARHYFPVSFLKKYIDILASYKLNVLQLHLTDDQGWRVAISKYPELTEISHWRDETVVGHAGYSKEYDGRGYGGFYTREQMQEIVRYAADRFITIVPEIEMPGHAVAALAALPGLGCTGGPYRVMTTWGVHSDVFCAGNDETFEFLENVLEEVIDIFPSQFIHIGGDECPKDRWQNCPKCQARIADEGLADEHELQSYFITRIDKFLTKRGRRLIGWDEILEGGLAPGATVMSWRGIEGGIKAAKMRHDVVMSPTTHLYLDYYQTENRDNEPLAIGGFLPLRKVYEYEPVPEDLSDAEAAHILGAQANLWTEYIPSTKHAEYMLLPRIQALAETVWTPRGSKNYEGFENRIITDYERLKKLGINFRDHRID